MREQRESPSPLGSSASNQTTVDMMEVHTLVCQWKAEYKLVRHLLKNAYMLLETGVQIKMEMPHEPNIDETVMQEFKRQRVRSSSICCNISDVVGW